MALTDTDLRDELDAQQLAAVGAEAYTGDLRAEIKAGLWTAIGKAIKRWLQGDDELPGGYDTDDPEPLGVADPGDSLKWSHSNHVHPSQGSFDDANPQANGVADPGSSGKWSHSDHVHPADAGATFSTDTPQNVGAAGAVGTDDEYSRSDHVHGHGDQAGGSLHSAVTTSINGFMSATDKEKLDKIGPSSSTPEAVGETGSAGSGTSYSRGNHRHAHSNLGGGSLHDAATQSVAGFMSATDKEKLDGLFAPSFAEIYDDNFGTGTNNITATAADTWYPVASLTPGPYRMSAAARGYTGTSYSYIDIGAYGEGYYKVSLTVSGDQAEGANDWIFAVCIGTTPTKLKVIEYLDEYRSLSASGLLELADNDTVRVYARCNSAGKIFRIFNINLSIKRIND